jgi:hypothetical protein
MDPGREKPEELKATRWEKLRRGSTEKLGFAAPFTVLLRPVSVMETT